MRDEFPTKKEFFQLSSREKERVSKKLSKFLKKRKEMVFAYLFGSFLYPETISFRDIDIGVYVKSGSITRDRVFEYQNKLAQDLEKIIKMPFDIIDVRVLNFSPNSFQNNVLSGGKLLFCKDEQLLTDLLESTSLEAISNEYIIRQSLKELIPADYANR